MRILGRALRGWWRKMFAALFIMLVIWWALLCWDRPSMWPFGGHIASAFPSLFGKTPADYELAQKNPYRLTTEETLVSDYSGPIKRCFNSPVLEPLFVPFDWSKPKEKQLKLVYKRFPAPNGSKKGAIVIVSGRTEGMVIYPELIYDLRKQGYSVYIHDHRGQGFSDRLLGDSQKSHVVSFEDYVKDIKEFFDKKVKPTEVGNDNIFILAHSMGGGVAVRYIETYPNDFKAAILVTPMNAPDTSPVPIWLVRPSSYWLSLCCSESYAFTQKRYVRQPFVDTQLTHSKLRWEQARDAYDDKYKDNDDKYDDNKETKIGGTTHGWVHASIRAGVDTRNKDNVGNITIPVLLFQATADIAVRNDAQEEFWRLLKPKCGDSCEAYSVEQAYHALFIEADTFRIPVLTKTLQFIEAQTGNKAPPPEGTGPCDMPSLSSASTAPAPQSPAPRAPQT